MWYLGKRDEHYYLRDDGTVWKVWPNGTFLLVNYDQDVVANLCQRVEIPAFAHEVIGRMNELAPSRS